MAKKNQVVNVTSTSAVETAGNSENVVTVVAVDKMAKARAIFAECMGMEKMPARKDILARFQAEAGCTKAGSATYLQILKAKNGLVQHKPKVVTA